MIGRILLTGVKYQASSFNWITPLRHLSNQKGSASYSLSNRPIKTSCAENIETDFNLLKDTQINNAGFRLDGARVAGSNVALNDLEFDLAGRKVAFNLTWLRDSCHCPQCTHTHSRQRLFLPKDFEKEKFEIDDVKFLDIVPEKQGSIGSDNSNNRSLFIKWIDGHESLYPLRWLNNIDNLYKEMKIDLHTAKRQTFDLPRDDFYGPEMNIELSREYWSVQDISAKLRPVDYNDLIDGFEFHDDIPTFINANNIGNMSTKRYESLVNLTGQLSRFGLAKIINTPVERNQVLRVARSLAYERPTGYGTIFDVVVEPSEEINLAYSSQEFDLHSDLTYRETSPGVQLLHCIRNSEEGGLSYFSDAFKAALMLKEAEPVLFEVLLQFPAVFVVRDPYRDIKFRRQKTILTLDHKGELDEVYYSPFMLPPVGYKDDVKLFYLALDKYTQLLQSKENKFITKMEPGDLFIFHNRRVLHGRSSYTTTNSNRFLQGCYMDWDEICCLHEKLVANKP